MSELTEPRDVLVVREDGPVVMSLLAYDTEASTATVRFVGTDRWAAVPSWTVVDPPYDMLVDRDEILGAKIDLATEDARRLSRLDATVLEAFSIAAGDGLTSDALGRRLAETDLSEFDLSITPKVVAEHLAAKRIETLTQPERSRRSRRQPPLVRRITGLGRLVLVERRLATAVSS